MNVQLSYKEGVLTAFLAGEIDHHSAREMREQIDEAAQKHKPLLPCAWIFLRCPLWTAPASG